MKIIHEEKLAYFNILYKTENTPEKVLGELENYYNVLENQYIHESFREYEEIQDYYNLKLANDIKDSDYTKLLESKKKEIKSVLEQIKRYNLTLEELSGSLKKLEYGSKEYRAIHKNVSIVSQKGDVQIRRLEVLEAEIQQLIKDGEKKVNILVDIRNKLRSLSKGQSSFLTKNLKYAILDKKNVRITNLLFLFIISYLLDQIVAMISIEKVGTVLRKNLIFAVVFLLQIFVIDPLVTKYRNKIIWWIYKNRVESLNNLEVLYNEFQDGLSLAKTELQSFKSGIKKTFNQ